MPLQRTVFRWIRACDENRGLTTEINFKLHATVTAKEVAVQYGVPEDVFIEHVRQEIIEAASCASLPFTIMMVFVYAVMMTSHNPISTMFAAEDSVAFGIEEDAEFARTNDNHGHKTIYDVDSEAEFWSWMLEGFVPLMNGQGTDWSEGVDEDNPLMVANTEEVPVLERGFFLNYNRIIGGIRVRQERSWVTECDSTSDLSMFYNKSCVGGLDYQLWPETWQAFETTNATMSFWLYVQEDLEVLQDLVLEKEVSGWLSSETKKIEITIPIYNAEYGIYVITYCNFFLSRGGHIWKRIISLSTFASWWYGAWNVILDTVWVCGLVYIFVTEVREMSFFLRVSGLHAMLHHYCTFWNLIDWIALAMGFLIVGLFLVRNAATYTVNNELVRLAEIDPLGNTLNYREQISFVIDALESEVHEVYRFRIVLACYPVVNVARLFKAFSSQPRLSLVTRTLASARVDLLHFLVVFCCIFFTYAIQGVILFGREVDGFTTLTRACISCFRTMMGDFEWEELSQIGRIEAGIWFMTFMMIIVMLMLNMLLAIVMDAYSEQKAATGDAETLWEEAKQGFVRWNGRRKGVLMSLEEVLWHLECSRGEFLTVTSEGTLAQEVAVEETPVDDEQEHPTSSFNFRSMVFQAKPPEQEHVSKRRSWCLVTVATLMVVCPKMTTEQAQELIMHAILDYYAANQDDADMEEMLMDIREVNYVTGLMRTKMENILMANIDPQFEGTLDKEAFEEGKEQAQARFLAELNAVRGHLHVAEKQVVGTDAFETAAEHRIAELAKKTDLPLSPLQSIDEAEAYEEMHVLDDQEAVLYACRECGIDTKNDEVRLRCLGRLCRALAVDRGDNTVRVLVFGVGEVWMGVSALGKLQVSDLATEKEDNHDSSKKAKPEEVQSFFKWGAAPWNRAGVPMQADVDNRIKELQAELKMGKQTTCEAVAAIAELERRLLQEHDERAKLATKFATLKRNVIALTRDNKRMSAEVVELEHRFRSVGEAGATRDEYMELVRTMVEENSRLKSALTGAEGSVRVGVAGSGYGTKPSSSIVRHM